MPGAASPFLDPWAPAQYVTGEQAAADNSGNTGAAGPAQTVFTNPGGWGGYMNPTGAVEQTYDTTLHYKLAGTIVIALVTVFVLQQLGFRFVVAAGVGR